LKNDACRYKSHREGNAVKNKPVRFDVSLHGN
jgi:hypothetical protein